MNDNVADTDRPLDILVKKIILFSCVKRMDVRLVRVCALTWCKYGNRWPRKNAL